MAANLTQDEADDLELKKLGYDQVLHRGLSSFSNFAFGFTEVAVLVSFTSQYGFGLQTGGWEPFVTPNYTLD